MSDGGESMTTIQQIGPAFYHSGYSPKGKDKMVFIAVVTEDSFALLFFA